MCGMQHIQQSHNQAACALLYSTNNEQPAGTSLHGPLQASTHIPLLDSCRLALTSDQHLRGTLLRCCCGALPLWLLLM
jgi:hypothetical protein